MKKIFLALLALALTLVFHVEDSSAYSITWDEWRHVGGVWAGNELGGDGDEEYGATEELSMWEETESSGESNSEAYAEMWTSADDFLGYCEIGSASWAYSDGENEWANAGSFGALYNIFTLDSEYGGDIQYWLEYELYGDLYGSLGGSYNETGIYAGIWIEQYGTLDVLDSFGDVEDLIHQGDILPAWSFSRDYFDYEGSEEVWEGDEDSILRYGEDGGEYELLALIATYSEAGGSAEAWSWFTEDTLDFYIELGEETEPGIPPVPEPASMLLFGLGALGFGIIKRKRR